MHDQASPAGGGVALAPDPYAYGRGAAQLNHSANLYPLGDSASAHPDYGGYGATLGNGAVVARNNVGSYGYLSR